MQLSFNTTTPNFKSLMIAPSGQKAIEDHDRNSGISLGCYLDAEQKKRENDKYIDAVIVGIPRGNGNYHPVMHIHDKVTGEYFRSNFDIRASYGEFGYRKCLSKDGKLLPEETVMITDSKGKTRYFTFNDCIEAARFQNGIKNDNNLNQNLGLPRELENYYTDCFVTGKLPKDKYAALVMKLKNEYGKPFEKIVPDIIDKTNLLGQGREKDVYKIDKLPDYVLCVKRDEYKFGEPVKPFYQCFQSNKITDSDEPIMMNAQGMYIKKYTGGKSHSLPNWYNVFHEIEPLTYNDVNLFISQLEELSSFPAKSYVNLAKELQKLSEKNVRIDTINPNNILIDSDLKTINLIDITSVDNKVPNGINRPINSLSDMEALLLDSMMFIRYYDMATGEDKIKLNGLAKEIMKKCEVAEKVTNLGNSTYNTKMYAESIDERIPFDAGGTRLERLEAFYKHFGNLISHEQRDPEKVWEKNFFGEEYLKKSS